jgi:hypothetical protein
MIQKFLLHTGCEGMIFSYFHRWKTNYDVTSEDQRKKVSFSFPSFPPPQLCILKNLERNWVFFSRLKKQYKYCRI